MNEIKAFVGHSFTSDDSAVVNSFLKYFDQIQSWHPAFSWEHAEAAEPRELADKVLSLVEGKNVFIGICTKKERVVAESKITPATFLPGYSKIKNSDIEWKTSDWIIQEIGLAIGRGLEIILLVEKGLRLPGGLQGNVEYIEFDRDAPANASGKILEMLQALSPKGTQTGSTTSDAPPKEQYASQAPSTEDTDWANPKSDWSFEEYKDALLRSVLFHKDDDTARIEKAYLASGDAKDGSHKAEWEARSEYVQIWLGKGGNLEKLKKLGTENPGNKEIQYYLARSLSELNEHEEAARIFEASARLAADNDEKQNLLGFAAIDRAQSGDMVTATSLADELRRMAVVNPKYEKDLLGTLRRIAEIQKDEAAAIAIMERIVEVTPGDFGVRFSLAYNHNQAGNGDLALHHYLRIPNKERSYWAWNNLGVSFDRFKMPAKSVNCYRKSEELGNTLAMSNLAYKFMKAGFLKEAQEQFDRALATKDYHRNVGEGLSRLKDIPDEEDKKKQEVLDGVKKKAEFYRLVGRSISRPPLAPSNRWKGQNCELNVTVTGNKLRAIGSYERDANPLLSAATPGLRLMTKYKVEYEGVISGQQIEGETRTLREGDGSAASSLLGLNDVKTKFIIVVCDGGTLKVMENPQGTSPTFYEMTAI